MDASTVSLTELQQELGTSAAPVIIDVRPPDVFLQADSFLSGALKRPAAWIRDWAPSLPADRSVVLYCEGGGETSRNAALELGPLGRRARFLNGGLRAWRAAGGAVLPKPKGAPTRWVTRERPKIDRIACPWLVARFIDRDAEFRYVKAGDVRRIAEEERAVPFDIPDVRFSHEGDLCSFDAFLKVFQLDEPALRVLATVIRGADTGRLDLAPEAAGLLAVSLGLSRLRTNDQEMLRDGLVMYDALYLWARDGRGETHTWNPDLYR